MDRYAFDTMKNGYNRYQVEDYIQTQKLQMESLQKKLEKANLLKEELPENIRSWKHATRMSVRISRSRKKLRTK